MNDACARLSETGADQVILICGMTIIIGISLLIIFKRRYTAQHLIMIIASATLLFAVSPPAFAGNTECVQPPVAIPAPAPQDPVAPQFILGNDIYNPVSNSIPTSTPKYFAILANDLLPPEDRFDLATLDLNLTLPGVQQMITIPNINNDPAQSLVVSVTGNVIALSGEVASQTTVSLSYSLTTKAGIPAREPALIQFVFSDTVSQAVSAEDDVRLTDILEEGDTLEIYLTANDTTIGGVLDTTSIDVSPNEPGIQTTYIVENKGEFVLGADGLLTFTASANLANTEVFGAYTIRNDSGEVSNLALYGVRLQPLGD